VGLVLLPVLITAFAVENFVRDVLAVPLLYAIWVALLLFESIPQSMLWAGLVLLAIVAATRTLDRRKRLPRGRRDETLASRRVETLASLLRQAEGNIFGRWRLAQRLGGLVVELIADDERVSQREIHRRVEGGTLDISPELRAYLRARLSTVRPGGRISLGRTTEALDLDPDEIVRFLEDRLRSAPGGTP